MDHSPMLKDWELYFERADGYDNRQKVTTEFAIFWRNRRQKEIVIPGKCKLGGKVLRHVGFLDGTELFTTDHIKMIKRIGYECICGNVHDLMCAITTSGKEYYFYSDESNTHMFMMLLDLTIRIELNGTPYFYLKKELKGKDFI